MLKRVGSIVVAMLLVFVFVFGAFASEVGAASTTGFVKQNGTWVFMRNGSVDKSFVGFAKRPDNNNWYIARGGKMDLTYSGLAPSTANKSKLYYANKGEIDWNYTGLVAYNGKYYAVIKGVVDYSFTGIIQQLSSKKWYFVRKGVYDSSYTGISKCVANSKLYYVKKGKLDWSFTGLVKNGEKYLAVVKGVVDYSFTGLIQHPSSKNWYYVKKGVYDKSYTGLAKSIANGKWYHVNKGKYDKSYTGPSKYNGSTYYVVKGRLQDNLNGFAKIKGTYYVLDKGRINYEYKGLAENPKLKKLYYASGGKYNKSFTGLAEYPVNGKLYYVKKGKVDTSYSGTKTINSVKYTIKNGVATTKKWLEVTGYGVNKLSDGSTLVQATLKNTSTEVIGCPTAYILLYDKNKKLISSNEKFQSMVAVLPGQSVTIEVDVTDYISEGAKYFSIREEGWAEQSQTVWLRIWGTPDLVPLPKNLNRTLKAPTKSQTNSINEAVSVKFGKDPKLTISGLKFDKIGSYPTVNISVKNNTGKTITNLNLYAAMLDSKGNIIDWFMFSGDTLNAGATTTLSTTPPDKWDQIAYFTTSYYSYDIGSSHNEWYLPTIPKAAKK